MIEIENKRLNKKGATHEKGATHKKGTKKRKKMLVLVRLTVFRQIRKV